MLPSKYRPTRVALITALIVSGFLWTQAVQSRHWATASIPTDEKPKSKIAKVSVTVNELNSTLVSRALRSHAVQNRLQGYQHFIDTTPLMIEDQDPNGRSLGTWSKPAYLLSIIMEELRKPESERLEWLFWFDADTIILNPYIALETFVPPISHGLKDIHMVLTENWDGINAGVFPIRVHPWSVSLLSTWIAYPGYHPDEWLQFRDQTALQQLLKEYPAFKLNWSVAPHRWFNSFPINSAFSENGTWVYATAMTPEEFDDGEEIQGEQPWKVLKGDMLVHFAGAKFRHSWMEPWADRAEMYLPEWSSSTYQEVRTAEAIKFWREEKPRVAERKKNETERVEREERRKMEEASKSQEKTTSIPQETGRPQETQQAGETTPKGETPQPATAAQPAPAIQSNTETSTEAPPHQVTKGDESKETTGPIPQSSQEFELDDEAIYQEWVKQQQQIPAEETTSIPSQTNIVQGGIANADLELDDEAIYLEWLKQQNIDPETVMFNVAESG